MGAGHTTTQLCLSFDDGADWTELATSPTLTGQVNSIGAHPQGTGFSLIRGGTATIVWTDFNGNITDTFAGSVGSNQGATALPSFPANKVVLLSFDNVNHKAKAFQTNGTTDGTSVTDISGTLPSAWTAGTFPNLKYFTFTPGPVATGGNDHFVAWGGLSRALTSRSCCT